MTTTATSSLDLVSTVAAAVRAPSIHNTQPWKFRLLDGTIEVYADRSRQLTVTDPDGTAMRVSCGAAIFNLRLAFAHLGYRADVRLLPDQHDTDLVARVTADTPGPATPAQAALYTAIGKRHSNRHPFLDTAVPLDIRTRLVRAAHDEGAWLNLLIGPPALTTIAELVHTADRILNNNHAYRTELASWTRPDPDAADGVPTGAGGPAPDSHDLLTRRDFGGPPRTPGHDYETDPLVAVLGSNADSPLDDLIAGQALQSVLLTATSAGLVTSLMSQPIDVPQVREQLRIGLRRYGTPQILLRAGYGIPGPPTPRRPLSEVLLTPNAPSFPAGVLGPAQ
jgi:nitroreductase